MLNLLPIMIRLASSTPTLPLFVVMIIIIPSCSVKTNNFVESTEFSTPVVLAAINKLKTNLAYSPDGLHCCSLNVYLYQFA